MSSCVEKGRGERGGLNEVLEWVGGWVGGCDAYLDHRITKCDVKVACFCLCLFGWVGGWMINEYMIDRWVGGQMNESIHG